INAEVEALPEVRAELPDVGLIHGSPDIIDSSFQLHKPCSQCAARWRNPGGSGSEMREATFFGPESLGPQFVSRYFWMALLV
ncbi:Putative transposable element, partial [Caligus rogercresseyi]